LPSAIITGCSGFIGSHLTDELLRKNWTIFGIDNFHPYYSRELKELNLLQAKQDSGFEFLEGSILLDDDLKKIPHDVDYLFHFAAIPGVRNSFANPKEYFKINVDGTKKILNEFDNIKKIIFSSSSSVYGELAQNEFPVKEDHPLNPISPYGESKKQAEELFENFNQENGIESVVLRFYTVYGPRQRPDEAFTKFIRLALSCKPISIYGDGAKQRDFTYVSDIINGTILAAERGSGIFNLGGGTPINLNDMVSTIENSLDMKIQREFVDSPIGDVQKTHADISKAQNMLGYIPKIKFIDGVKKSVEWCRSTFKTNLS